MRVIKDGKQVIFYPSWHDDMRKMREDGAAIENLMEIFGVGNSTVRALTSKDWRAYMLKWNVSNRDKRGIPEMKAMVDQFLFEPRPEESPAKREISKKERSSRSRAAEYAKNYKQKDTEMAKVREFGSVSKLHEGKMLKGAKIKCSKCGASQEYYNYSGTVSSEHLPKEFARRGWFVGNNERTDLCPTCIGKMRAKPKPETAVNGKATTGTEANQSQTLTPEEVERRHDIAAAVKPIETKTLEIKKPEPSRMVSTVPREMDKTDRRLIFARLNEIYGDDMYLEDWTDLKAATDLDVPVEWVATVREADFGPNTNAALKANAIAAKEKALSGVGEKIERQLMLIEKKLEQMQALDEKVTKIHNEIADQIERFEEVERSLEVEDKHIKELLKEFGAQSEEFKKLYSELRPDLSSTITG